MRFSVFSPLFFLKEHQSYHSCFLTIIPQILMYVSQSFHAKSTSACVLQHLGGCRQFPHLHTHCGTKRAKPGKVVQTQTYTCVFFLGYFKADYYLKSHLCDVMSNSASVEQDNWTKITFLGFFFSPPFPKHFFKLSCLAKNPSVIVLS